MSAAADDPAVGGPGPAIGADGTLSVAGVALTDLAAVAGAALWAVLALSGRLGAVERALALAPLVVVPLGVGLVAPAVSGPPARLLAAATAILPVGAAAFVISLATPSGTFAALAAASWLPVTGLLAVVGLARVSERGLAPLSETLVDGGLAYSPVAAVALVAYHLDVTLWFDPTVVFLTAVHFHFAGFALPVLAGVAGRRLGGFDGLACPVAWVVLVGPALIAVGIAFSPLVEVLAVGAFTLAVAGFGLLVLGRVVPSLAPLSAALVGLSALALPVSMALALAYGVAAFGGPNPLALGIGRMAALHGSLNAYGFALLGVVGWRLVRVESATRS